MVRMVDLGCLAFPDAYRLQDEAVRAITAGQGSETLFLLEHPPVYTIGSGGRGENILDPEVTALRINRGGDVTFHGPGQLVGYPLINLDRRSRDLHRYLRFLEEVLIALLGQFGIAAHRVPGKTGVWTAKGKIAAIGVGVRRWVTMHGFALNVDIDLAPFRSINPCGLAGCPLTSMARELGADVEVALVKEAVVAVFNRLLDERLPEVI